MSQSNTLAVATFSRQEIIMLVVLIIAQFTHNVDFMLLMPLSSQLMSTFGVTASDYALLVSAYTFSAAISGISSALFIDRFERKRALLFVYTGLLIGTLLCALSVDYYMLLLARIVAGAFGGVLGALILSVISDTIPLEKRARAIGFNAAAFSAASALGIPFSLYLANLHSWHTPFFVLATIGCLVLVAMIFFLPRVEGHLKAAPRQPRQNPFAMVYSMLRDANRLRSLLFISLLVLGQFSVIPFIAPYLTLNVGFDGSQLTLMYLIGGVATVFSAPFIGKLADRFGTQLTFRWVALLSAIPILGITLSEYLPSIYWVYVITGLFFILVSGRFIPATTLVTATVDTQQRGSFMSVVSSMRQLSNAIGSLLGGLLIIQAAEGTPMQQYYLVGLIALFFTAISMMLSFRIKVTNTQ